MPGAGSQDATRFPQNRPGGGPAGVAAESGQVRAGPGAAAGTAPRMPVYSWGHTTIQPLNAIEAVSLTKTFGDIKSVDGATFEVEESEVFGFLGSNGAGKSTTMMILTTLLKPTSGRARVAGYDVVERPSRVREKIGYVQQESAIDEYLTGRENLVLQARLNHVERGTANHRIDELLEATGLVERQHDPAVTYSGGMKKRLDIACGLLHRPSVLFLDEPTVGLDIQTRRRIWDHIRQIHREYRMTVFISTHYMEEADMLCDRVCIIDEGSIKVVDSPGAMKERLGREMIHMDVGDDAAKLAKGITGMAGTESVEAREGRVTARVHGGAAMIPEIFGVAAGLSVQIRSVSTTKPTMDDVFISYTGHQIRDHPGGEPRKKRRR